MSFLLSFNKLQADYVCVLHPLSYLIKKANFRLLAQFIKNYSLIDGIIISSHEFSNTSKAMAFPILIGLYKRDKSGMNYDNVRNYSFKVKGYKTFRLSNFDTIADYVQKYPNKRLFDKPKNPVENFWTSCNINALKRNRTFIDQDTHGTVYISTEQLPYYCYIDIFKQYADQMPYFIGNCDVIIDIDKFEKIKDCFVTQSVQTNPILKDKFEFTETENSRAIIDNYFRELLKCIAKGKPISHG